MTKESDISSEYRRIERLIESNPDDAWNALRTFVAGGPSHLEAQSLTDYFLTLHLTDFIEAVEEEVKTNSTLAYAIADTTAWGGASGPATERLIRLQAGLRKRLGFDPENA